MTKVEKVKKLMEKYGLSLEDLEDVVDDEETKTEPKTETGNVEPTKVEEPKETEKVEKTEPVEEPKVENGTTEEPKVEPDINVVYKTQFDELNKKFEELKALVDAQTIKTDKAYEILDAQGKKVEEDDYEFAQKLGSCDIRPTLNNVDKGNEEFANALQSKKIR